MSAFQLDIRDCFYYRALYLSSYANAACPFLFAACCWRGQSHINNLFPHAILIMPTAQRKCLCFQEGHLSVSKFQQIPHRVMSLQNNRRLETGLLLIPTGSPNRGYIFSSCRRRDQESLELLTKNPRGRMSLQTL
jgi:hypothetical protein